MLPDLNRLKVFSYVYRNQSISKAARELDLSQPAVSQHIKKLERELRLPLFTRVNRRIVPTPAARRLYDQMNPLITQLHQEIKYLRRPFDTPYGLLRIGAPELFAGNVLTAILTRFRYRFPTVTFALNCGHKDELLSLLSFGSVDLALIEHTPEPGSKQPINDLYFSSEILLNEPYTMVCSKKYFDRNIAGKTDFEHLIQREYLTINDGSTVAELWFQSHYKRLPQNLNYVLKTDNFQSFLDGVRNGMGLGVIPFNFVNAEIEKGSLACIENSGKQVYNTLSLVQLKNKEPTLTEKAFIAVLKKELAPPKR